MIKLNYPIESCPNYKEIYWAIYNIEIADMQRKWSRLRYRYSELHKYPRKLKKIILADYHRLASYYISYMQISEARRGEMYKDIDEIFNYDKWGSEIAYYFMEPDNEYKISTCHYCDSAYVNNYEIDTEKDAMFFLNTASDDELKKKLVTDSTNSINTYKSARPYKIRADFDAVASSLRCSPDKYDKVFNPSRTIRRHFDVEHVLPKANCPLVGLSLFNFVPSCQVCNSKLKGTRVLGTLGVPIEKLSPTSPLNDFDRCVKFQLTPIPGCKLSGHPTKNPESYTLDLDTSIDPDYEYVVNLFKLNERYKYHKMEALHWLEMKYRYTEPRLVMMANALHSPEFSAKSIKQDIFQTVVDKDHHRVFDKLKKDILA